MSDKELQRVTKGQGEGLKALGFDWPVDHVWRKEEWGDDWNFKHGAVINPSFPIQNFNRYALGWLISAPTVSLALKWLRDTKPVRCGISPCLKSYRYRLNTSHRFIDEKESGDFDTHDAAESALLDAVLEELKKEKGK